MPRKAAKKISPEEWKRHQSVILSLSAHHSWFEVAKKMEKERNFFASPEQYDAQMRAWNLHKNLKRHEWQVVLQCFDQLASRHQTKVRMRILDKLVSEDKLRRSRNRYSQVISDTPSIVPSYVSFEVLGTDGTWSKCTGNETGIETPQITRSNCEDNSLEAMTISSSVGSLPNGNTAYTANSSLQPERPASAAIDEHSDFTMQCQPDHTSQDLYLAPMDIMSEFGFGAIPDFDFDAPNDIVADSLSGLDQSQFHHSGTDPPGTLWTLPGVTSVLPEALQNLPFQVFQNNLRDKGVDLRNFGPVSTIKRIYKASEFSALFLRDVADTRSRINTSASRNSLRHFQSNNALLSFQSLLPGEAFQRQCENNVDMTGQDTMLEANFIPLLLFSIANGFAGLGDTPIASVLKFLGRHSNIEGIFRQILQGIPCDVAKSLAENLFKAAIEAKESHLVKQLLESPLIQINEITCMADGQTLTAVERAAQLQDLKTVYVLLSAHPEVNKSFDVQPMDGGALKRLLDRLLRGETTPDALKIVEALLGAGAKAHAKMLKDVIERTRHSDVAVCLLRQLLPTHDTDLISNDTLSTQELELELAYKSTKDILDVCQSYHQGQCLRKFWSHVEVALVKSATRGHLQVVQMLLPFARNLDHVLSASFRGGNRDVLDAVLAKNPRLNSPAFNIDYQKPAFDEHDGLYNTTPLAEAIRTEVSENINLCEKAGALGQVHLTGHFEAALAAAAATGNLEYIHKLFHYKPSPQPKEMFTALLLSIRKGHDEISLFLIAAGADLSIPGKGSPAPHTALFAAVHQQNALIARKILDSGDIKFLDIYRTGEGHYESDVLEEAIIWGDRSLILDIHFAFPRAALKWYCLAVQILLEDEELLAFLIDIDVVDGPCLTRVLERPIKNGDIAKALRLIELGADPSDDINLARAAKHQSEILKILLQHIPKKAGKPRANLGTLAICTTINLGFSGINILNHLLLSEVVDIHSCEHYGGQTPLGMAIEQALEYKGGFPIVERLLEAGCNPNSVVFCGRDAAGSNLTALLAAINTKSIGLVKLLLEKRAEVNTKATRGLKRTPLQLAAELGCLEMVQLLLGKDADVNALPTQRGGGTALQLAAISGNCNIAFELLNHGANPYASPSTLYGRWPIEGAAEHGRLDMIDFLLKVTDYNHEQCKRAMKFAQCNGQFGCRDLIQSYINRCEYGRLH